MKPPTYLEIVGPAAAGKTTLARELESRSDRFAEGFPPDWRRLRDWPFFVRNFLSVVPAVASLAAVRRERRLDREEFFYLMFLNGWRRRLDGSRPDRRITILDQGPVYMLSLFVLFRQGQMANPFFGTWWQKTVKEWGRLLHAVIWLDAADEVLVRRINTRGESHLIKGASRDRAHDFLEQSRAALDRVVGLLRAGRSTPAVIRFDSGHLSADEIARRLSAEFPEGEKAGT
jgi:hypothetical protein